MDGTRAPAIPAERYPQNDTHRTIPAEARCHRAATEEEPIISINPLSPVPGDRCWLIMQARRSALSRLIIIAADHPWPRSSPFVMGNNYIRLFSTRIPPLAQCGSSSSSSNGGTGSSCRCNGLWLASLILLLYCCCCFIFISFSLGNVCQCP